jgi:hypothetical protein
MRSDRIAFKSKEASSVCVVVWPPLMAYALLILLDYISSGIDARGKGFHEVVLAP